MSALYDLFSECDAVFTEHDALTDPEKRRIGFGRVYRAWKRANAELRLQSETFGRGDG